MKTLLLLAFFIISSCSCSKEEVLWSKDEVFNIAKEHDSTFSLVIPKFINEYVVNCADYRPICISGHKFRIKTLEMIAIEYASHDEAKKAAKSFGGYYKNNWAFDSVQDEPILERFIVKHYGAVRVK